jgi:LysR family transcriptional regulator, hypochlorite-specific transcription factor HypT
MELKWLEDFVAIVHTRNFSRAAQMRHVTQPGLSRRLKSLEIWFGVPLIDRSTYPVTLTPAGEQFYELANKTVANINLAKSQIKAPQTELIDTIQFAMPHSLAMGFFPKWWQQRSPPSGLTTKVVTDSFTACVEMLSNRTCQFLICYLHPESRNKLNENSFEGMKIGDDVFIPVSAPSHSGKARYNLLTQTDDLLHAVDQQTPPIPLLTYAPDSFLGKVLAGIVRQPDNRHVQTVLRYESTLAEAIKAEVLIGEGLAWLPKKMVDKELNNGELIIAGDQAWHAPLEIWLYRQAQDRQKRVTSVWHSAHTKTE